MNRNCFAVVLIATILLAAGNRGLAQESRSRPNQPATAPEPLSNKDLQAPIDEDIDLLRRDVRAQSRLIVAAEMDLTNDEAAKFWPIYDQYSAEMGKIDDAMAAVIRDYLQAHETMDGDRAEAYLRKRATIEDSVMQLRLKYISIFRKTLSGRLTALFFQVDWRLGLLKDLQLAQMPMIDPKPW
jgi:hypothetical protein